MQTPQMTKEEALAQLNAAVASTRQQLVGARRRLGEMLEQVEARRAHAQAQREAAEQLLASLEASAEPADAARRNVAAMLVNVFGAARRMLEIEAAAYAHNLQLLDFDAHDVPERLAFRVPSQSVDFLEARAFMDLHVAMALMSQYLDGADLVMRAAVGEGLVVPGSGPEAELRRHLVEALQAAMAEDAELAKAVTHIGNELYEGLALIDWGKSVLADSERLPEAARRPMFEDADWALLNAKAVFLCGLAEKAAPHEKLAPFFPPAPEVPLPYEVAAPDHLPGQPA